MSQALTTAKDDIRATHRTLSILLSKKGAAGFSGGTPSVADVTSFFVQGAARALADLRVAAVTRGASALASDDLAIRLKRTAIMATWRWSRGWDRHFRGDHPELTLSFEAVDRALLAWTADALEFLDAFPVERLKATRLPFEPLGRPDALEWARLFRILARDLELRVAVRGSEKG